jgi:hypothetical protein
LCQILMFDAKCDIPCELCAELVLSEHNGVLLSAFVNPEALVFNAVLLSCAFDIYSRFGLLVES